MRKYYVTSGADGEWLSWSREWLVGLPDPTKRDDAWWSPDLREARATAQAVQGYVWSKPTLRDRLRRRRARTTRSIRRFLARLFSPSASG